MNTKKLEAALNALIDYMDKDIMYDGDKDKGYICEIFADYREEIPEKDISKILLSEDPEIALYDWVDWLYEDYVYELKSEAIHKAMKKIYPESAEEERDIWYALCEYYDDNVIVDLPFEHFMKQMVNADLMVDTGDSNKDYSCNTVYPYCYGDKGIDDDASLVWLAKTQGYSKEQLEEALDRKDVENGKGFLDSVWEEVANEATSLNCLTFLVKMSMEELIKLHAMLAKRKRGKLTIETITISKKATVGLYDAWEGAGSLFGIEMEKDAILPVGYIHSCLPDSHLHWTVEETYGMVGSAWKDVVTINEVKA